MLLQGKWLKEYGLFNLEKCRFRSSPEESLVESKIGHILYGLKVKSGSTVKF